MTARGPERLLFAGTYTDGRAGGIFELAFNEEAGSLRIVREAGKAPNPSFVVQRGRHLYAAHELDDRSCLAAYAIEGDGSLVCRGSCSSPEDAGTCFVAVHPDGRCLYGANDHHKLEALFKACGQALRQAVAPQDGGALSTKGVLA